MARPPPLPGNEQRSGGFEMFKTQNALPGFKRQVAKPVFAVAVYSTVRPFRLANTALNLLKGVFADARLCDNYFIASCLGYFVICDHVKSCYIHSGYNFCRTSTVAHR